jgi:hypothetical protein
MEITLELAESLIEKFLPYIDINGPLMPGMSTNCHTWTGGSGGRSDRYGRIPVGHVDEVLVHRLSWVLNRGLIQDGLFVLHRCDNPPCVRKEHFDCRSEMVRHQRIGEGRRVQDDELRSGTSNASRQKILESLQPIRPRPSKS